MLVLTRKPGESLFIGGEIEIKIVEVSGDRVRIGIEAPAAIKILRKELKETIEQNKQAAQAAPSAQIKGFLKHFDA